MTKKILFVTAFPPNARTAGQNYSMNLIDDLSKLHQVDVIYWNYDGHYISQAFNDKVNVLKEYKVNIKIMSVFWSILLLLFPFFTTRFNFSTLLYIRKILNNYDILYFDFSQIFVYSLFLSHPCKVMMCHDVISQKFNRNSNSYLYKWWVKCSENRLIDSTNRILCFSDKDKALLSTDKRTNVEVVSFYIDKKIVDIRFDLLELESFFCFYGAWNRNENLSGLNWFISEVLPLCNSDITFKIIGGGMPSDVIAKIEKLKNIFYIGFVDNPYCIIAKSKALLAPLFSGAGVKVKVIESLASGTPVIGTNISFEGITKVEYADNKIAQMLFSDAKDMATIINRFHILKSEKEEIQNSFLSLYGNHKFVNSL